MTANVQGSNILDVLKKKMRATKEECEKYKEEAEDLQRKLQVEISRREEVSFSRPPAILSVILLATPSYLVDPNVNSSSNLYQTCQTCFRKDGKVIF